MKEVNFWDTNYYKENYKSITKDILKGEIRQGNHNLIVLDKIYPSQNPLTSNTIYTALEQKIIQLQIVINYTDKNHQILKENKKNGKLIINTGFLNQNKDEILKAYYTALTNTTKEHIIIERELFDNDRFNKLIKAKESLTYKLNIDDHELSDENKKYLKDNFIKCLTNESKISDQYVIGNYTLSDLKQNNSLTLNPKDILTSENLKYLKSGSIIELEDSKDEETNFNAYSHLIATLETNQIETTVIINKELISHKIKQIDLENITFKYTNIKIENLLSLYTSKAYHLKDNYIKQLIKNIKNSRFSTFEKYMQLYKIIERFNPKDSDNEKSFTTLLQITMQELGIENLKIDKDKILFYLEDDKYNIKGYFISITTWSHYQKENLYPYSAITFKELKNNKIESDIDYIFNVTNMNEFSKKINELIDKKIHQKQGRILIPLELPLKNEKGHQKHNRLLGQFEKEAILEIFNYTTEIFRKLDYKTYLVFIKKFAYLNVIQTNIEDYYSFLTELGSYIVKNTNNRIYEEHKLTAAVCTKIKNSNKHEKREIRSIINNTKDSEH